MVAHIGYAVKVTIHGGFGWIKVIDDGVGNVMDITGADTPFEATIYLDQIKALTLIDIIRSSTMVSKLAQGASLEVSTFVLEEQLND